MRTPSRRELLFARSSVVAVAHAHGLDAVDLVCVRYGGEGAQRELEDECREGREMGFTGASRTGGELPRSGREVLLL